MRIQERKHTSPVVEAFEALSRYPVINKETKPDDIGLNTLDPENYFYLGRVALDAIRHGLLSVKTPEPGSFLDLPSGGGRVVRYLCAEYPDAEVAACDIDHSAVKFCASTFGATPIWGQEHPREVKLDHAFDVIWCGSLLTHLDAPMWDEFFDFFERALNPGGLLLVTVTGRPWVRRMVDPDLADWTHWVLPNQQRREALIDAWEQTGFGFSEYETSPEFRATRSEPSSYGLSLVKPAWLWSFLERRPLRAVSYTEAGWASQDVVALQNPVSR